MAFETKALLSAIASIMRLTDDIEVAYDELRKMANTEGVILEPRKDTSTNDKSGS